MRLKMESQWEKKYPLKKKSSINDVLSGICGYGLNKRAAHLCQSHEKCSEVRG